MNKLKNLLVTLICLISVLSGFSQIGELNLNWLIPSPDSTTPQVIATDPLHSQTYIGGNTTYIKNSTPRIVQIDELGDLFDQQKLKVNGTVNETISDNNGGYYIAGEFTEVNGISRNRIAHIDANNNLTPFQVDVNDSVICLSLNNNVLYFGGEFTEVNGVNRSNLAAVDASSGILINWSPVVNGNVYAILATSTRVFIGGYFTFVNYNANSYLACLDPNNGASMVWNQTINGPVHDFQIKDNVLYCCGSFSFVSGQNRGGFASFDLNNLTLTSLNNGGVIGIHPGGWGIKGMEVLSGKIYLYGQF